MLSGNEKPPNFEATSAVSFAMLHLEDLVTAWDLPPPHVIARTALHCMLRVTVFSQKHL